MSKKYESIQFIEIENESDLLICRQCGEWTNTVIVQEWLVGGYVNELVDEELFNSSCCG